MSNRRSFSYGPWALALAFLTPCWAKAAWKADFSPSWSLQLLSTEIPARSAARIDLAKSQRATVVVFLSAKCPCSQSHESKVKQLAETFSPQGFTFIGVHSNSDELPAPTAEHFQKAALGFPVYDDRQGQLADALGALKTPHAFVIDSQGQVLYRGGIDDSQIAAQSKSQYLKDALEQVAASKDVQVPQARALGCMIRRD